MKTRDDVALMRLVADGNEWAFAEIVRRYQDVLLNFFLRASVSYTDGQDLAQRTFLRLWRYRKKYTAKGAKFTTFLFMLARQVSIDFFRAESHRQAAQEALAQAAATGLARTPARPAASSGSGDALGRALRRLTPPLREAVELVVFQDMPYADAAAVLGVPLGTVKSRIFNALRKLKDSLEHECGS